MRSSIILPALFALSYSMLALALPVSHVNTLTDPYAHTLSSMNSPPTLFGRQMIRPDWRNAVAPAAVGERE
ncbi:hypothetical protein HETIRDRAFT_452225 [Heterobasidion irregulare TC 32-1]|uniref:Uncharacterized protein n=1 Tax=Heterobasidion irregulare (strain TC 32-1) TaxID=747525 RepID=W4K4C3_HETIT|nr:uncharacterized protein HETIRDRAFT_452225 [Heterobasidion irregulare TC 32-1]ETW80688.1 hypothetical protein HETIRDRAFT_452225 [Heterobasidion irregulare TC 32-1]